MNNSALEYRQIDERLSWKSYYQSALSERNPHALARRIADAEKAITECELALSTADIDNKREKENLTNAYRVLEDLRRLCPATKDATYTD